MTFNLQPMPDDTLAAPTDAQHGRLWIDFLSFVPFVYLLIVVGTPSLRNASLSKQRSDMAWVISLLSLIRLVRLVRLVSLSRVGAHRIQSQYLHCHFFFVFNTAALREELFQ